MDRKIDKASQESLLPKDESLGEYVSRIRKHRGLSAAELSRKSGISYTSIYRIENGRTKGQRFKCKNELAQALQIPADYLVAASKNQTLTEVPTNKICPSCWKPGTPPDLRWSIEDAEFCLRCGTQLVHKCECGEELLLIGKFCPHCGKRYQNLKRKRLLKAV